MTTKLHSGDRYLHEGRAFDVAQGGELVEPRAEEVSRLSPGPLLGAEAGDSSGADDLPGGQLQADGSAGGGKLRPTGGSIVSGERNREVIEVKQSNN